MIQDRLHHLCTTRSRCPDTPAQFDGTQQRRAELCRRTRVYGRCSAQKLKFSLFMTSPSARTMTLALESDTMLLLRRKLVFAIKETSESYQR